MKYNNKRIRAVASVAFAVTSALSMAGAPQANAAAFQGTSTMVDPETGAKLLTESGSMTTRTSSTDGHGTSTYVSASTTTYASGEGARVESDDADARIAAFDTAIGHNAKAIGSAATAIGAGAEANSMYGGTAVGTGSVAKEGQMVTAVGFMAKAEGNFATAYGANANAAHAESVALGANSKASNEKTTAVGTRAQATSWNTTAVGTDASASGDNTLAMGADAKATAMDSTAVGTEAEATAKNTSAYGRVAKATSENATALGTYSEAKGSDSTAIGVSAVAANEYSTAIGDNSQVTGFSSTAIGADTVASGNDSVALGVMAKATGAEDSVFGFKAQATAENATAIGSETKATEENSTAIGAFSEANGTSTLALGYKAVSAGDSSMALGANANASAANSTAFGRKASAAAKDAMAIGVNSKATAEDAIAIGVGSVANEKNTVSVGQAGATRRIVNVTAGVNGTDAVNVSQLRDGITKLTNEFNGKLDGKANISLNNISDAGKNVIKELADSVDDTAKVTTKDKNLKVTSSANGNVTTYDVALSRNLDADSYGVGGKIYVSGSGLNANSQKIINVAAGTAPNDAVNVKQLQDAVNAGKNPLVVEYDTSKKDTVTLKGAAGTAVTNVKDGQIAKDSKDAVNGGQIYGLKQEITNKFQADLAGKANVNLDNITNEGAKVITDLADSVDDTAEVVSEDKNIEVESEKNGNTATYKLKLADNINAKSFSVNGNVYIDGSGINANSHRIINVANGVDDNDAVNVKQLNEAVKNASTPLAVLYDSKAKDAVTLAGSNGTTITNVKAGELSKTSSDAVNGSQLYATNQNVESNAKNISVLQEADKLNVKYTDASKAEIHLGGNGGTRITNVAQAIDGTDAVNLDQLNKAINEVEKKGGNDKNAVHYTDDTHKVAKLDGEGGSTLTGVADGEVSEDSQDAVNGSQLHAEKIAREKADKELDQRIDKEAEERKAADEELSSRIGYVSEGDHNIISSTNNVAQNLEALDQAIIVKDNGEEITIAPDSETKVINVAGKGGEARVITGVATDPSNGSSAANVDYVNSKTKEAKDYADGIGAQAAAMASLHPLEWDREDKVSVSASIGAYKSEVAGAVGAYYRPDRKTMFNFQGAFGSNDNMFGIGVSKKLGDKETPENGETMNSEEVLALREEVQELRRKDADMEAKYQKILDLLMAQTGLNQETVKSLVQTDEPDSSGEDSAEDVDALSDGQGQWVLGEDGLWHNENLE